ncbi:DNA replication/repair protein RecF [Olsenella sp. HMSC062G07]|uniref:DNA replication/repair protein RecF n=1 Tax=Olsenella sp. HMSC062G07 TaxID=1739330 RepID=UPI0008A35E0B|nr:DNA replication and repair protein RecF [Olsenella sp. HMSC062G07]OFK22256.1 DNA recombination protein RecF [Olsenella sp. HMSC062G07]
MGLLVRTLTLDDWRNFRHESLTFAGGMTILHGHNAAGKTNVIEALQLLTAGCSFRRPRPQDLILEGASCARAAATLTGDGRVIDVACRVEGARRLFERNGKRCVAADLPASLMSVLFTPDDLSLVKRGASWRRDELDAFGRQANKGYGSVLGSYLHAVEQRNRLLKDINPDSSLLEAWDESLSLGGATLLAARVRMFTRLAAHIKRIHAQLAEGECLDCSYLCSLGDDVDPTTLSRDELREIFLRRLGELREQERRRQQTLVGPQRDDVTFLVDGRDARSFASQGQQRTIVLAWKMAELALSHELTGGAPLLLLDDVMSELDERRRSAMTSFVQEGVQTVITTTNLGYFPASLLGAARVVNIGE